MSSVGNAASRKAEEPVDALESLVCFVFEQSYSQSPQQIYLACRKDMLSRIRFYTLCSMVVPPLDSVSIPLDVFSSLPYHFRVSLGRRPYDGTAAGTDSGPMAGTLLCHSFVLLPILVHVRFPKPNYSVLRLCWSHPVR